MNPSRVRTRRHTACFNVRAVSSIGVVERLWVQPRRGHTGVETGGASMGGQTFELLGLLTLAGFAGVFSIVLATAGFEALDHSALVGLLVLGFAVVLLLTTASVGIWGVIEWIRADGTRATPDQDASARDAEGRIRTVRGAMQQRAFIQLVCKVAFFCSSINLGVEMYNLRRCERIFLIVTPPDHHYCDNLAYHPTGIASINPQSRTFFTEMPGTVRLHCRSRAIVSSPAKAARAGAQTMPGPSTDRLTRQLPLPSHRRGPSDSSAQSSRTPRSSGRSWGRRPLIRAPAVRSAQSC